jgi:ribosomal protein S18 acetylase RimI-like enzyme
MTNDFEFPDDLYDYLDALPIKVINDIDSFELVTKNSILGILDTTLDDEAKKLNEALPDMEIRPIRGIGTQIITADTTNLKFKIFNTLGFHYSDGTELAISSNGNNSIEIVSFKISNDKRNKGVDEVLMEFLFSYLHISLLYIPAILVMVKNNKPSTESEMRFFNKYGFSIYQKHDEFNLLKRPEEQILV